MGAAGWFSADLSEKILRRKVSGQTADIAVRYALTLRAEGDGGEAPADTSGDVTLRARLLRECVFCDGHETERFQTEMGEDFAFDHAQIILRAILALRKEAAEGGLIAFDLLPERFTLASLQQAYEAVLGQKLTTPNFRRKIADAVRETDDYAETAGHRPAKLFERDLAWFYGKSFLRET